MVGMMPSTMTTASRDSASQSTGLVVARTRGTAVRRKARITTPRITASAATVPPMAENRR